MSDPERLAELARLQLKMTVEGGDLRVTDRLGVLTEGGRHYIAKHKAAYLAALASAEENDHD